MNRRSSGDPILENCLLVVDSGLNNRVAVKLDYAAKLAVSAAGPVSLHVPLLVDRWHLRGPTSGAAFDNIATVLQWGYSVRALPRRRGPGGKEVGRGLFGS